jgi:SAM-dependent methyltransferase
VSEPISAAGGARAAALYDPDYARRYREHDDELHHSRPYRLFAEWLHGVCAHFVPPIDVLDLGCGTGRYFCALTGVRQLTGIDASPAMLAEARHPYRADQITAERIALVGGDFATADFAPAQFDLVYSIGVLAEHAPLDADVIARVSRWLKPRGRFAFTTVHPDSPSIPRTFKRRLGRFAGAHGPASIGRTVRPHLLAGGMYADEQHIMELTRDRFDVEELRRFESEAHLHCLCVARKRAA